ncbi:MAG: substrate-binding domain-containing protein [Sphaerochaetaceae bacterium]|nr:substrate-binding domain-containing protein [Sphaerochaetaceae bacterium]
MKKVLTVLLVLLLACSSVLFANPQAETKEDEKKSESLSGQAALIQPVDDVLEYVFIPKVVHPWYDVVQDGALAAAENLAQMGVNVKIKFDPPTEADLTKHMEKIESNVSRRPDGIAIAALDPASEAQLIDDAIKAGVNVITFDTDAPDSSRPLYVGHNKDFEDGYRLGHFLADTIGEKGEVGILSGSLSAPNHVGRVKGFKAAISEYPNIDLVFERADNDNMQKAVELTENALQAHSKLVGIFGCNASAPIGAARAIKLAGKAGKVHIVGMDDLDETLQLIEEGVIDATAAQRQWEQGYWSVMYLTAINMNHTIPAEHQTGSRIITKADL